MGDFEVHCFTCGILYLLNSRITEFNHLPASCADKMIVLFALVRFFELGNILAELMLNNESAIKKEFNGIVKSGTANPVLFVLHEDVKGFDVEMAFVGIYFFEYRESFGRFSMPFAFKVIDEDFFNRFLCAYTGHSNNCLSNCLVNKINEVQRVSNNCITSIDVKGLIVKLFDPFYRVNPFYFHNIHR